MKKCAPVSKFNLQFQQKHLLILFLFVAVSILSLVLFQQRRFCGTKHVVFLKTHKTGGSSIQNILMRYGIIRNYTFVVPAFSNYLGHPKKFEKHMARALKSNSEYNIFTHHSRFSKRGISSVMPADSFYFTILRNPYAHFESLYSFFQLKNFFNMSLDEFVGVRGSEFYSSRNRRAHNGRIGRNQLCFDLGLDTENFDNASQIIEFTQQIETDFDLILINEHLSESLILLKDTLCWTIKDLVVLNQNVRKDKFRTELTEELKSGIQYWNQADVYIYNHFYNILEQKIADYGKEKMAKEVAELEKLNLVWYNICVDGIETEVKKERTKMDIKHFTLKINSRDCCNLIKLEMDFTLEIQEYMKEFYELTT